MPKGKFRQGVFTPRNRDKYRGKTLPIYRSGWELKFFRWCDLNENVMKVFNVINSVNLKTSYGGTSTKNIKMMISNIKKDLK